MPQRQTAFATDELIARVECLSLEDGDAYPGILSVSRRRLSFLPIVRDATSAVSPWQVPMREIQELELGSMEGTLTIRTEAVARTVMGTELKGLLEDIETALQAQADTSGSGLGENQVVIEGPMDLYINDLLATRGQIQVTTESLRFSPGRSLESMIWGDLGIDCPVDSITEVELTGMRRRIVVKAGETEYAFRGPLAPRVYGVVSALVEGGGASLDTVVIASWKASVFTGPLTQPGELVLTRRRLRFTPAGRLEALMGLQRELNIDLADVTRVDVEGLIDRRLVITIGMDEYAFQVPKPLERAQEIKDLMLGLEGDHDPIVPLHGARRATPEIIALFERWSSIVGDASQEEVLLFGPGIHQGRRSMFRRGWICLTTTRVIFFPCGGPEGGERPLLASLPALSAKGREDAPIGELNLSAGEALLRFVPRGGEGFIDTFFFLWREELERTDEFHLKKHGLLSRGGKGLDEEEEGSGLTGLGFVNRRETYRAVLQGRSTITIEVRSLMSASHDHFTEGVLRDLSLGGCSVITEKRLPERSEFGVEIQAGAEVATINARLVYCLRMGRKRVQWRQGLTFSDMSYTDAQLVRDLVTQLQREELSRRSDGRDDEEDEEF